MTQRDYTKSRPASSNGLYTIVTWDGIAAGDTATAIELAQYADRTVQVSGDLDGGTVAIQGSIDGTNYHNLTDPQGNALAFTLPGIEAVTEIVVYLKPVLTGGGASAAVTVNLLMKG